MTTTKITKHQRSIAFTEVYLRLFNQIWNKHKIVVPIRLNPELVAHKALIILEFTNPEVKKYRSLIAKNCEKEIELARQEAYKIELKKRQVLKTSTNKAYIINVIKVIIKRFKIANGGKKFSEATWFLIMKNVEIYICSPKDKWWEVISKYFTYKQLQELVFNILKDVNHSEKEIELASNKK